VYKREINVLANSNVNYINKKVFLATYKVIYKDTVLSNNIRAVFKASKLVLHNLEVVILKLNLKPYTLTLLLLRLTL
jgi:hypothetical protein